MPFSTRDLLLGIALPAVIAFVLTSIAVLLSRKRDATGVTAAIAVIPGFLAGYWLLKLGPFLPEADRDWLPYAAVFALIPAMVPQQSLRLLATRLLVLALTVVVVGWLLVPTWDHLEPSRTTHLVAWSAYTFFLSVGMLWFARVERFPDISVPETAGHRDNRTYRPGSRLFLFLIVSTLAAASGLLLLSESLLFCQIMAVGMAAFAGFAIAYWCFQCRSGLEGVSLVYSLLISAALLTGKVNSFSSVPTTSYLILPLTPLAYGLVLPGRAERITWKRTLLVIVAALVICGLAIGLALAAEFGGESEY